MKKRYLYSIIALAAAIMLSGCHKDDNDTNKDEPQPPVVVSKIDTVNVDVILPSNVQKQWQPSIEWALANIETAQQPLASKVMLNLRYHNEDTEDLDRLAYKLTHPAEGDDTCHAIIGPFHSANADAILRYAERNRLPVVMPTCTSSELQRTNARSTYAWFLTESDITQCELMIYSAKKYNVSHVALIYSNDTYGQSFRDWFGYYAAEQGVQVACDGVFAYQKGASFDAFIDEIMKDGNGGVLAICVALSNAQDINDVCATLNKRIADHMINDPESGIMGIILSDTAFEENVMNPSSIQGLMYGISPTGAYNYGFPQSFEARVNRALGLGDAQIYDALTLIALGAAHQTAYGDNCLVAGKKVVYTTSPTGPGLTDHMRSVVSNEEGASCGWNVSGLSLAFKSIAAHISPVITGASSSLNFDNESYTKALNTNYTLWTNFDYQSTSDLSFKPILHLSTEGSNTQSSTSSLWQMENFWTPTIEDVAVNHNLPDRTDRWAVVVSPSTTWSNYRHQADAFAMYQTLRKNGYDDDHIILIVEDNLANDPLNLYPGEIFVERSTDDAATSDLFVNDDVRKNSVVDYHFSALKLEDIANIMLGRSSDRLPHVIHPTASSDVFFFWSGHGGSSEGPLWGNENATEYFGKQRIKDIVTEMNDNNMYRRMMFAIETCYSGKWGEALDNLPDVLVLTAATAHETSKADMYDRSLGVYLSNAFARTFRRQIYQNNDITIYDLYRALFKTTKGSHVTLYNQHQYGSVYSETMGEFLQ